VKVPIQNLYYLLCFAWEYAPDELSLDIVALPPSSDVLDLCAFILTRGMGRLLRAGLDQGYQERDEFTTRIRGRINMTQTLSRRANSTPRVACRFDELTPNVIHNQIIRSTIAQLMHSMQIDRGLRDGLRKCYRDLTGIDVIAVSNAAFGQVQLHQNRRYYRFFLFVCRLVHALALPLKQESGGGRFIDLISNETIMQHVFEKFLRNFYRRKQGAFTDVNSVTLTWEAMAERPNDMALLPTMHTDVTLRSQSRTVIIDAKYYKDALQANFDVKKAHSDNLYQLLAYLRAEARTSKPIRPEGILVYPVGESRVDASFIIDGFPVRLFTLDLGQPWQDIEKDLLKLLIN
jgi:5-methylcytosine-specific restriction enzyme subunit McrC